MSWLEPKIAAVLREKHDAGTPLKKMMEEVLIEYAKRRDNGHLRVHDRNGEGVLFGVRKNVSASVQDKTFNLSCSQKTWKAHDEVAFSRGLFNQKRVLIGAREAHFISYEAALLRKSSGKGGGACKLDLVALEDSALWAIEYKQRTSPKTSTRYGILEALAYGFLLALHLRDNNENMRRQVEQCIRQRGPYSAHPVTFKGSCVKFAVAAPTAFYREDLKTAERLRLTDAISEIALNYGRDASNLLRLDLSFGGFIVVGDSKTELVRDPAIGEPPDVVPRFVPPPERLPIFTNIREVCDSVRNN